MALNFKNLFLLGLIFLCACEPKPIKVDIPNQRYELVMYVHLTNDSTVLVQLGTSKGVTLRDKPLPENDCVVSMSVNGGTPMPLEKVYLDTTHNENDRFYYYYPTSKSEYFRSTTTIKNFDKVEVSASAPDFMPLKIATEFRGTDLPPFSLELIEKNVSPYSTYVQQAFKLIINEAPNDMYCYGVEIFYVDSTQGYKPLMIYDNNNIGGVDNSTDPSFSHRMPMGRGYVYNATYLKLKNNSIEENFDSMMEVDPEIIRYDTVRSSSGVITSIQAVYNYRFVKIPKEKLVVKLSKYHADVFTYLKTRNNQRMNSGNPFSEPVVVYANAADGKSMFIKGSKKLQTFSP